MRLQLTDEQKRAAATQAQRAYIEAGPGCGKTTVAAERYGVLRFDGCAQAPGLMALSFARSARGELEDRVRRRWGSHALRWPHKVWTLDSLHCAILAHLLRTGQITWPGGHTELTVHDSWRGQDGSRPLSPDRPWRRVVTLNGRQVVSGTRAVHEFGYGYPTKVPYEAMLAAGVCTHDEVRQILEIVVWNSELRPAVVEYLRTSMKALIVDEVFDGDRLDLAIVHQAAAAGIPSTLIGDPWQALYEFRGARPELVARIIADLSFDTLPVTQSFRFETPAMQQLARALRGGEGVAVPAGTAGDVDVVLASWWKPLWSVADNVLPLAFGQVNNRTDAAMAVLLERFVCGHFGHLPTRGPEAAMVLGLDPEILCGDPGLFAPVLDRLEGGTPTDAGAALALLRTTLTGMGSRPFRKMKDTDEADRIELLGALGRRLGRTQLIPGMTIHQAKGREWANVGVYLQPDEDRHLAAGLSRDRPSDRALYVALTRAKRRVCRVLLVGLDNWHHAE
jgi:DNA helicase-2/ATP-dependent DNA helicase PcrA